MQTWDQVPDKACQEALRLFEGHERTHIDPVLVADKGRPDVGVMDVGRGPADGGREGA